MMKAKESPYRVIVMGKTGSGKSSVLNSLTRTDHYKVGDSIMSETREVQTFRGKFKGRLTSPDIVFIDTPGFFDSSSRDNKVIAKIAMSLHQVEDGLNLVLFCFPAYEIRLDSSMQASWRFLKLVMGKAVYEHVVIVLTHGNRLTPHELENAVTRMTTEFIPYLKNNLKCKVKEEILIYQKGEENDGLEEVLKYITSNSKYKPKVMEDLGRFWRPDDPLGSIEYLLQNSQIFNKIQDLLLEMQNKNEDMQDQMDQIKQEMEHMALEQDKQVKTGLKELAQNVKTQFEEEKTSVAVFKEEVGKQIRVMQRQLDEKDKKIEVLRKGLEEIKVVPKPSQPPLTTRSKERIAWEKERPATTDRERDIKGKLSMEEELKHSKQSSKDMRYQPAPSHIVQQYTKAQCIPVANYHTSPTQQMPPKAQPITAAKPPATILKPQVPQSRPMPVSKPQIIPSKEPSVRPANPQVPSSRQFAKPPQQILGGRAQPVGKRLDYLYGGIASITPRNPYIAKPSGDYHY